MIGTRLGPYEITAKLGQGGMGEVYRAKDPKLGREVAIKVLPKHLASDQDALQRFEREARAVAALSHPNILAIFDFGHQDDSAYAVMELLDGETLQERLAAGALPARKALEIAAQVASGLAAAHERGLVHRDLKPANLFLTRDGQVKILDFGLARQSEVLDSQSRVVAAPTQGPATEVGSVLGTVGYMAPEQVRGLRADHRADVFSLGVVLYEMLTGRRAFARESAAESMTAILREEPPEMERLGETSSPSIARLVQHCLEKRPEERFQSARDLAFDLRSLAAGGSASDRSGRVAPVATGRWRQPAPLMAALVVSWVLLASVVAWLALRPRAATTISAGATTQRAELVGVSVSDASNVAISRDGREVIAYDATPGRVTFLRRKLDSFEISPVAGADGNFNPFYSPDGRSIGFFDGRQVCVLELEGSSRRCLAEARGFASAFWGPDGTIIFSSQPPAGEAAAGLWRVPSAGGEARRLTTVDGGQGETAHVYPQLLPDGRTVLFTIRGAAQNTIASVSLEGGAPRRLLPNAGRARLLRSGHLVYWSDLRGRLYVTRWDPQRGEVVGTPVEMGIELNTTGDSTVSFEVSDNGTLVYSVGGMFGSDFTVGTVDRRGQWTSMIDERGSWGQPRLSPNGRQLLLRRAAQPNCTLWLFDLDRRSLSRIGVPGDAHNPLWLADGERFLISRDSSDNLRRQVFEHGLDGGAGEVRVRADFSALAEAVSADGRFIALTYDNRRDRNDVFLHDTRSGATKPFAVTEYDEDQPAFSPDGTLLAYEASDSGRSEVYVRGLSGAGKYPISNSGGSGPVWSRDGRELFYVEGNRMMRVGIERSPRFAASAPQLLFESPDFVWERPRNYDVLPDSSGFVIVRRGAETPSTQSLRVVFDWFAELERLLPSATR